MQISLDALRSLKCLQGVTLALKSRRADARNTLLPPKAHQVLVERDTAQYNDNSLAESIACASLVAAGYTDDAIFTLFQQYQPPHFLKRHGSREWLQKHVIDKARSFVATAPKQVSATLHADLQAVYDWIHSSPWTGRSGPTDRTVMLALWKRASLEKALVFRASLREVVELAGVGKQAVIASLSRLQGKPVLSKPSKKSIVLATTIADESHALIEQVDIDPGSGACRYRFVLSNMVSVACHTTNVVPPVNTDGMMIDTFGAHDAFHMQALGKSAYLIWTVLLGQEEMTQAEIVTATGKARSTVQTVLQKLAASGLAKGLVGRWEGLPATETMLDAIAESYGTAGRGEARAERHSKERENQVSAILIKQRYQWESHNAHRLLREGLQVGSNGKAEPLV